MEGMVGDPSVGCGREKSQNRLTLPGSRGRDGEKRKPRPLRRGRRTHGLKGNARNSLKGKKKSEAIRAKHGKNRQGLKIWGESPKERQNSGGERAYETMKGNMVGWSHLGL